MRTALIGYTGFVGSNLERQCGFDDHYHSANIASLAGRDYQLLVCAGAPAAKWKANQDPDGDQRNLATLREALAKCTAEQAILISTIDVFPDPRGVDEDAPIERNHCHPYGGHRLDLEQFFAERFDTLILRLPGLFGPGLKKNLIYDFLHDNNLDQIDSRGMFQFYDLRHLWADIRIALYQRLRLVHLATEPTSVAEVAQAGFGLEFRQELDRPPACYDFRSRYAALYGGQGGYLYDRGQVLADLRAYVAAVRSGLA
jgi:nucleoside-diphosphate-sugar epimerase